LALITAALAQNKPAAAPDVWLISIDTLRADHVHCYGYAPIQTPALDSLARGGIRFAQAFTPSPITNTSHVSILTGLLPSSHGVTDFAVPLAPEHPTLAQLLKKQGYQTAAFIGAAILDSSTLAPGLDSGFDYYDNFPQHPPSSSRWGRVERRGLDVVQRAETWLAAHRTTAPHFVWIHLYDPHDPYDPPAPYSQTYKDRLYDGEIAYADSAVAHFIAYLKSHRQYENALIVVVGDHGEGLGEHGENTHGIFLYDSTTHVPLILKLPGQSNAGRVIDAQVRTIDILPTLLDLTRAPAPAKLDGASLKPYFGGTDATARTAIGETDYPLNFGWAALRSVRAEGLKFIEAPRPELYDLGHDPAETENEYEPWNPRVLRFRKLLAELRERPTPSAQKGAAGPQTVAELKALGYLGAADVGSHSNVPEPSLLPDPKDKIEQQNLLHTALTESEEGRRERAREALEKVLQLDPKSYAALLQLGQLEFDAGQYAKSAEHLAAAHQVNPDDASPPFYEGEALANLHDFAASRDALEASLKLKPRQFQARLLLGEVYLDLGQINAAQDEFEAARLIQPQNVAAKLGLIRILIAQDKAAAAIPQLLQLAKSDSQNAEVFERLGQAYRRIGKILEARTAEARAKLLAKK
jgi:arylsulfatase A-like enzyme/Flp pilus assembly protein TadD